MSSSQASSSLSEQLRTKKNALLERLKEPASAAGSGTRPAFVVIMGNEAGDTDSMASALLLSELLSTGDQDGNEYARKFSPDTTFVPLMQLPHKDLGLRAENEYLLDMTRLKADSLLFLDELPDVGELVRDDVILGITDHPKLSAYWQPASAFEDRVQIIVDHHADEGSHPNAQIRVLNGPEHGAVASAISVVVDLFKDSASIKKLNTALADLSLAALLIDTDDLRSIPQGKATDVDLAAARILVAQSSLASDEGRQDVFTAAKSITSDDATAKDAKQSGTAIEAVPQELRAAASSFHQILSAKKLDVSRLDGHDLLRRDYKESAMQIEGQDGKLLRAGFSSVPVGLSEWIHTRHGDADARWDAFWTVLRSWMTERHLDVAIVGTSFQEAREESNGAGSSDNEERKAKSSKHRRELIMAYLQPTDGPKLFKPVVDALESEAYATSLNNDPSQRLELDMPWKGLWREPSTGKKERVGALDKHGRWRNFHEAGLEMKIAVWRQRNGRASRKVYLPAVMHALKAAAAAGTKGKA